MTEPTALGPETADKVVKYFDGRVRRKGAQVHRRPEQQEFSRQEVWVQAPVDGIPEMDDATGDFGTAVCTLLVRKIGPNGKPRLYKTTTDIEIANGYDIPAGPIGDRRVKVEGAFKFAEVIGWPCNNTRDPTDIEDA